MPELQATRVPGAASSCEVSDVAWFPPAPPALQRPEAGLLWEGYTAVMGGLHCHPGVTGDAARSKDLDQHAAIERFLQEILCRGRVIGPRGDDHHGDRRELALALEPLQHLPTVHHRHHQIEDDQ